MMWNRVSYHVLQRLHSPHHTVVCICKIQCCMWGIQLCPIKCDMLHHSQESLFGDHVMMMPGSRLLLQLFILRDLDGALFYLCLLLAAECAPHRGPFHFEEDPHLRISAHHLFPPSMQRTIREVVLYRTAPCSAVQQ